MDVDNAVAADFRKQINEDIEGFISAITSVVIGLVGENARLKKRIAELEEQNK